MSRLFWILMLGTLLGASACERIPSEQAADKINAKDLGRDAPKAVDTAIEYSQQAKDELQRKLEDGLERLDAQIVTLGEKGRDLKDQAKLEWDQKMADLDTKRNAVAATLSELRKSGAEAWKEVQQGAQSAWDELEKALRDASKEF